MSHGEVIVVEEAERQFEFIQALKKLDFYATRNLLHLDSEDEDDDDNDDQQNDDDRKKKSSNLEDEANKKSSLLRSETSEFRPDADTWNDDERDDKENGTPRSKLFAIKTLENPAKFWQKSKSRKFLEFTIEFSASKSKL